MHISTPGVHIVPHKVALLEFIEDINNCLMMVKTSMICCVQMVASVFNAIELNWIDLRIAKHVFLYFGS